MDLQQSLEFVQNGQLQEIKAFIRNQLVPAKEFFSLNEVRRIALDLCKEGKINLERMQLFFPTDMLETKSKRKFSIKPQTTAKIESKRENKFTTGSTELIKDCISTNNTDDPTKAINPSQKTHPLHRTLATFAGKTIPNDLILNDSEVKGVGVGVWTFNEIKKGAIFGPFIGVRFNSKRSANKGGHSWDVFMHSKYHHCIDATDANKSNWMRYVARDTSLSNLEAFQKGYQVYYRALCDIPVRSELVVRKADRYDHDASDGIKTSPTILDSDLNTTSHEPPSKICNQHETPLLSNAVDEDNAAALDNANKKKPKGHKDFSVKELTSKRFRCEYCPYATDRKLSLFNHLKNHTKPYKCHECQTSFSRPSHLRLHQRTHTGEKPFKCNICNKAFARAGHLNQHIRTHTGEKAHRCDVCGKKFSTLNHLTVHQRIHTGEKPFKCDDCPSAFSHKSNLSIHRRIHSGEKPYRCHECTRSFAVLTSFQVHRRTHSGDKPFKCEVCNSAFSQKFHLQNHMRTHTGEKPFRCDTCEAAFSEMSKLQRHKRIHTGERPYRCQICDSAFTQISHLHAHRRIHTGEKPYKCVVCGSAFADRSYMNKHVRAVHHTTTAAASTGGCSNGVDSNCSSLNGGNSNEHDLNGHDLNGNNFNGRSINGVGSNGNSSTSAFIIPESLGKNFSVSTLSSDISSIALNSHHHHLALVNFNTLNLPTNLHIPNLTTISPATTATLYSSHLIPVSLSLNFFNFKT